MWFAEFIANSIEKRDAETRRAGEERKMKLIKVCGYFIISSAAFPKGRRFFPPFLFCVVLSRFYFIPSFLPPTGRQIWKFEKEDAFAEAPPPSSSRAARAIFVVSMQVIIEGR